MVSSASGVWIGVGCITLVLLAVLANVGMLGFLVNHESKEDCPACTCPAPISLGETTNSNQLLSRAESFDLIYNSFSPAQQTCINDCLRTHCSGPYTNTPNPCTPADPSYPNCPVPQVCIPSAITPIHCCVTECVGQCPPGCACHT
jgi:hypothetical protein